MPVFDFSPTYRYQPLLHTVHRDSTDYPAYNIEAADDDHYRIAVAVAGFAEGELSIEQEHHLLTVKGVKQADESAPQDYKTLHRGIALRNFVRRYQLAEHVEVNSASLEHGVLYINLVRQVPEAKKPKTIAIGAHSTPAAGAEQVAAPTEHTAAA